MTEQVDQHFIEALDVLGREPSGAGGASPTSTRGQPDVDDEDLLGIFDSQLGSRHLDLAARWLRAQGKGFYTIGSSGHEGNAAVAAALRPSDPALLHYRSGAFYLQRARQVPGQEPLRDVLLGIMAAAEEPIAGGRHKVFGNHALAVIPQTSTIASHLPRAVGVAWAIARAKRLGVSCVWPEDALAVCSFGDASVNHSTALGGLNAAVHAAYQGLPMPLLFVCEDNGIGISVRTPPAWVSWRYGQQAGMEYFEADGCDLRDSLVTAERAAAWVRERRRPAFLHLHTVRLMGHAGSDVESGYRRASDIASDLRRDPLLATARLLLERGVLTTERLREKYEEKRDEVLRLSKEVADAPQLQTAEEVMRPLTASRTMRPGGHAAPLSGQERSSRHTATDRAAEGVTMAQSINRALAEVLESCPEAVVFGEDVARKGGVYGVTRGLLRTFGAARVFDTLLDEQSILGLALGSGLSGLLPIPEIQYLAYVHNAADQLRGEGATLQFFSSGQYRNPMVVRIAGYGFQKGFGGHFHNDNSVAALRDIPGMVVASPARPDDAAAMLQSCVAAARNDGTLSVFLEPIALYHARDLHTDGDGDWLAPYPTDASMEALGAIGRGRTYGDGSDLTIVTFANGLHMSLRVARRLTDAGIGCRVLDLRWLAPLPVEDLLREASTTGRVLIVDETRHSGGVSESVMAALCDSDFAGAVARVTSRDSFVPLGDAARLVLVSEDDIDDGARKLLSR